MSTVSGRPTIDQWPSCAVDTDVNVYEHSSQRQSNPSAAITHTTSTDSLTHFLEEPVCTLALSVIFNLQDGFVAFVCHGINGPELRAL